MYHNKTEHSQVKLYMTSGSLLIHLFLILLLMSSNKIHVRCGCRARKVKGPILGENVSNNLEKKRISRIVCCIF